MTPPDSYVMVAATVATKASSAFLTIMIVVVFAMMVGQEDFIYKVFMVVAVPDFFHLIWLGLDFLAKAMESIEIAEG